MDDHNNNDINTSAPPPPPLSYKTSESSENSRDRESLNTQTLDEMQICNSPKSNFDQGIEADCPDNLNYNSLTLVDFLSLEDLSLVVGESWYIIPKEAVENIKRATNRYIIVKNEEQLVEESGDKVSLDNQNSKLSTASVTPNKKQTPAALGLSRIDCSQLLTENNKLRKDIRENDDFILIDQTLFKKISSVIGLADPVRDEISRPVISVPGNQKQIDMYPHEIMLKKFSKMSDNLSRGAKRWCEGTNKSSLLLMISKHSTVSTLYKSIFELYKSKKNVDLPQNIQLYIRYNKETKPPAGTPDGMPPMYNYIKVGKKSISQANIAEIGLDTGATIVIDARLSSERSDLTLHGNVTELNAGRSSNSQSPSSNTSNISSKYNNNNNYNNNSGIGRGNSPVNQKQITMFGPPSSQVVPGQVGLDNLGNTCFMASALQCMSNIPALTEYFLSRKYIDEINTDNPIGSGGMLAKEYANLLTNLWAGNDSSYAPRNFKLTIGRWNNRFANYQQQDSHEFLSALVDGIHEDLNRIKKKPYVEAKDANGRPDEEVSNEAWEGHKKRNDSIVTDNFHGQFKSTVKCPSCNFVSVTFDPFVYLTLPVTKTTSTSSLFSGLSKLGGKAIFGGLAKLTGQDNKEKSNNLKEEESQISVLFIPYDDETNKTYIAGDWIREVKIKLDKNSSKHSNGKNSKNVGSLKQEIAEKISSERKNRADSKNFRDLDSDDLLLLTIMDGQIVDHWNNLETDIPVTELPNSIDCKGMSGLVAYLKKNWKSPYKVGDPKLDVEHDFILPVAFRDGVWIIHSRMLLSFLIANSNKPFLSVTKNASATNQATSPTATTTTPRSN